MSMTPEQQKVLKLLLSDFKVFLKYVWAFLGLPEPTPVQYAIADYLQHGPKRNIIMGFRGVGKSWITAAYVIWLLLRNPQEKILVVSASKRRADDFSTFTLRLIKSLPITRHLIPGPDQRESIEAFDVGPAGHSQAPSVTSKGISSQLTGSRATRIIADDIEVVANSATQDAREKLLAKVAEFDAILVPDAETEITYLGTPQTEESIYNVLRGRGYEARIWPALYPTDVGIYRGSLAPEIAKAAATNPKLVGKPTDPRRFTEVDLMERQASYGKAGFALQFLLDTSLSDAERYPLKTSDIIVMGCTRDKGPISLAWASGRDQLIHDLPFIGFSGDRWYRPMFVDPKWAAYEGIVMALDPSGRGTDELGYAIVAQLHGNLFVLAAGGLKGGYDEDNLNRLGKLARDFRVNMVIIEANFGDGMFTKIFQPVLMKWHQCGIEEVKHSVQKERRIIDTLEPVMTQHRLIVSEEVVRSDVQVGDEELSYSLFYQMTRITYDRGALKHDDRLDALAIAVNYWVESMSRDDVKSAQRYQDKLMDQELRTFLKNALKVNSHTAERRGRVWTGSRPAGLKVW